MSHTHSHAEPGHGGTKTLLGGVVVTAIILTGALYNHGTSWWYAPVAVVAAAIAGHLLIGASSGFLASKILGRDAGKTPLPRGDVFRLPKLYDRLASVMLFGQEQKIRDQWLELAEIQAGDTVLDIGCGTGTLLLAASKYVGPTGMLRGLEASPEMTEYALNKAADVGIDVDITVGSADALPYPDNSIDVALCTVVLHHLPLELQMGTLREMRRVVRPGGRVVIIDMHHEPSGFLRLFSLITVLHHGRSDKLVNMAAELETLGFNEISEHPAGSSALVGTRGYAPLD